MFSLPLDQPVTRYYVDEKGRYIGGFQGSAAQDFVPAGAREVRDGPAHAACIWDGTKWGDPPPAARAPITPREWLERLSPGTQEAITTAAITQPKLLLWLLKALGSASIDVTAPEAIEGVAALRAAGVITAAEHALLLGG